MTVPPLPYGPEPAASAPPGGSDDGGKKPPRYTADGRLLPPAAGAGRRKGSVNKVTLALKEAILLAAEEVGDDMADAAAEKGEDRPGGLMGYLKMVAATDVKSFCALLGKVLPMQITGAGGGALEVTFRTVYEGDKEPEPLTIDHEPTGH